MTVCTQVFCATHEALNKLVCRRRTANTNIYSKSYTSYDKHRATQIAYQQSTHQNVQPMSTVFRELNINHGLPDKHEEHGDGITEVCIVGVQATRRAVGYPACTDNIIMSCSTNAVTY